jgi:dUTP pyrophosphatase
MVTLTLMGMGSVRVRIMGMVRVSVRFMDTITVRLMGMVESKGVELKVKVKKLSPTAIMPTRAHESDAGFDLYVNSYSFGEFALVEYCFGISIEIPQGYVGLIFPRSSIKNYSLRLSNSVGVIDSGYRGELKAFFELTDTGKTKYNFGDRAAQLVIMKLPEVEMIEAQELSESDRGRGGYGSTGI